MLVVQRHQEIAALVRRERSVRVTGLAHRFQVTEETIRRDLDKLETDGIVVRSHGGAIAAPISGREAHHADRASANIGEKLAIARRATEFIEAGDTLLLDASTTGLELARLLPNVGLTVVTNSIPVCTALADRQDCTVICTGGVLSAASLSFVGPQAERHLADFHVRRLFFSCSAVDIEHGLSDINEAQANLKKKMMAVSDHNYLLFDHSKLGVKALQRFCPIGDVDTIITTANLDLSSRKLLTEQGVELVTVEHQF